MTAESGVLQIVSAGISLAALTVSALSLWFSGRLWVRSNRPIVSALVQTNASGTEARMYDLAVINSGSRPAVDVALSVNEAELLAALAEGIESSKHHAPMLAAVRRCFSKEGEITLLLNNQTRTNSFGFTGAAGGIGPLWKHGASFEVRIAYKDLDGRRFQATLPLRIKDSESFAGGAWTKGKKN